MPEHEQRARSGSLNIVSWECQNEELVRRSISEFPSSHIGQAQKAARQESEIVEGKERQRSRDVQRVWCRFNAGRERELRDWNIVTGSHVDAHMDEAVKHRPSVWEWCATEALP
jgi:hypothetical protein